MRSHPFSCAAVLVMTSIASSIPISAAAEPIEYATVVAQPEVRSKTVSYADLNLQRREGVAVLYRRIQVAAELVCHEDNERALHVWQRARTCASDATARAIAQVGVPALAALHAQQGEETQTRVAARGLR